jgi:hypothetical protein
MNAVLDTLRQLELERGERIKRSKTEAAEERETAKKATRAKRGIWLRDRTQLDADEPAMEITPGDAPGDIQ